jgi:hypothetical protein
MYSNQKSKWRKQLRLYVARVLFVIVFLVIVILGYFLTLNMIDRLFPTNENSRSSIEAPFPEATPDYTAMPLTATALIESATQDALGLTATFEAQTAPR